MLRSAVKLALVCVALLAAASCDRGEGSAGLAKPAGESADHSDTFGLIVSPPPGWYVMNYDQTKKMMDVGVDIVTAGNDQMKALAEPAKKSISNIFAFFKSPPGAPVEFNPAVMAVAENVSLAPGIRTGRDYFFHAKRTLEQSAINTEIVNDSTMRKIGGQEFDQMDIWMTMNGVTLEQSLYAARHGDDIILITQLYHNDAEREETSAIIDSIKLDW
jgi:hypothetical protein